MNDKPLSGKERALLEAARREVAAKAPAREARPAAPGRAAPRAPVSPLDAPTVLGWDHPAAQTAPAPPPADDKWARVALLMEAERREAEEKRRRTRGTALAAFSVLVLIVAIVLARALIR
jgi:hypothetical protein